MTHERLTLPPVRLARSERGRATSQVKKHVRSQGEQKGGIFQREAPLHVSNVALLDPKDKYARARASFIFIRGPR